jgi:hypothetical protein
MSSSLITSVLIIAAISLAIGYITGWLLASLRGDKGAGKDSTKKDRPGLSKEDVIPDQQLLLKIWRGLKDGRLLVELGKSRIVNPDELTLEQRRVLLDLLKDTGSWMGLNAETIQTSPPITPQFPSQTATGIDRLVGSGHGETGIQRPSLIGGMTTAIADVVNPVQSTARQDAPKSIVQQIDEILQEKLIGTPYDGQKIYITEDPRKGVVVWVGSSMYEGVGAMPESDVKKLLRASVQEWEKRQELARRRSEQR